MSADRAWVLLALGVLAHPFAAVAAESISWHAGAGIEEAYNDNVQQSFGQRRQSDWITTTITASAGWEDLNRRPLPAELSLWVQGHVYRNQSQFNYVEIRPQASFPLAWNTDLVLAYLFSPNQVLYDDAGTANAPAYREHQILSGLRGRYGARKQIRTQLSFRSEWDTYFNNASARDSWTPQLLWEVAYRFDRLLPWLVEVTPRIGVVYQVRHARRANFDRESIGIGPGFDLRLPWEITVRFRYDWVNRDYTVGSPREASGRRNNNFDRNDRYDQYQVWTYVPVPWLSGVGLRPRYRFRSGYYDQPNRRDPAGVVGTHEHFDVHEVGLELLYAF